MAVGKEPPREWYSLPTRSAPSPVVNTSLHVISFTSRREDGSCNLYMREWRLREVRGPASGHTANMWQSCSSSPNWGMSRPEAQRRLEPVAL